MSVKIQRDDLKVTFINDIIVQMLTSLFGEGIDTHVTPNEPERYIWSETAQFFLMCDVI